jgi:hypothetical protein
MRGRGKLAKADLRSSQQSWRRPVARWRRSCLECGAPPKMGGVLYLPAGLLHFLARDPDGVVCGVKCGDCGEAPAIVLPRDQ